MQTIIVLKLKKNKSSEYILRIYSEFNQNNNIGVCSFIIITLVVLNILGAEVIL